MPINLTHVIFILCYSFRPDIQLLYTWLKTQTRICVCVHVLFEFCIDKNPNKPKIVRFGKFNWIFNSFVFYDSNSIFIFALKNRSVQWFTKCMLESNLYIYVLYTVPTPTQTLLHHGAFLMEGIRYNLLSSCSTWTTSCLCRCIWSKYMPSHAYTHAQRKQSTTIPSIIRLVCMYSVLYILFI